MPFRVAVEVPTDVVVATEVLVAAATLTLLGFPTQHLVYNCIAHWCFHVGWVRVFLPACLRVSRFFE